jgi:4-alpha-glucanotransferase
MKRSSGILLHPTSLPGPYGIGDFGRNAYAFLDWLHSAGQSLWQVLPLGPTGFGDSPYAAFSTFAGNPLLIGLEELAGEGWLAPSELVDGRPDFGAAVDFGQVIPWKKALVARAARRFTEQAALADRSAFNAFVAAEAWWLDDYALFMDIKEHFDSLARSAGRHGAMWSNFWPKDLALADPSALGAWSTDPEHAASIEVRRVEQYFFFKQWLALKAYANARGIAVIGDLPIFVAADSVDAWANRRLFKLDSAGQPEAVAGVPPDYFSQTGQLWGNPLYDWPAHQAEGFAWWIKRIQGNLRLFDWLRVDHFRAFEAYWAVPFGHPTAERGRWEKAPGREFFTALSAELGRLPILAEDLGFITPEVRALRDDFHLPGMKILEFAFDASESEKGIDARNGFLPHMYSEASVVYTGTHDNDTLRGWIGNAKPDELAFLDAYLDCAPAGRIRAMIRAALASVAAFAVIPMQDLLGLGSSARMNTPSTLGGNWSWRTTPGDFRADDAAWLKRVSELFARNCRDN